MQGTMDNYNKYILVVDDDMLNRELIAEILVENMQTNHYHLDFAVNGEECLQKLQQTKYQYDVILLDRMMPVMDGMQVLQNIKEHEQWKYIPIIMQTAKVGLDNIVEGIEVGVFQYLTKPFEWEKYMEFDPGRAFDPNGRGIAMAQSMSFDKLEFFRPGNKVKATLILKD